MQYNKVSIELSAIQTDYAKLYICKNLLAIFHLMYYYVRWFEVLSYNYSVGIICTEQLRQVI